MSTLSRFGIAIGVLLSSCISFSFASSNESPPGPQVNTMSCTKSSYMYVANGGFACYGLWDYGSEFGNDQNMCPTYDSEGYSNPKTGCKISTRICTSGFAKATKIIIPSTLGTTELSQIASRLSSSTGAVRKQILKLWEYTCYDGVDVAAPLKNSNAVVYGVYEGIGTSSNGSNHPDQIVYLEIPSSAQGKYLVLTAYEPVVWTLRNPNNIIPKKIVVVGYHSQKLTTSDNSQLPPFELNSYETNRQYASAYKVQSEGYDKLVPWLEKKGILFNESDFYGIYSAKNASIFQKPSGTSTVTQVYSGELLEKPGPQVNSMSCSRPPKTGLENGALACYGIWDYGSEFGNDQNMCQDDVRHTSTTGCKITTPACKSGLAIATKTYAPNNLSINSPELAVMAKNLNATIQGTHDQIPALWEYTCYDGVNIPKPSSSSLLENKAVGFEIKISSVVRVNVPTDVRVRAIDSYRRVVPGYVGSIIFIPNQFGDMVPNPGKSISFSLSDKGEKTFTQGIKFVKTGQQKVSVVDVIDDISGYAYVTVVDSGSTHTTPTPLPVEIPTNPSIGGLGTYMAYIGNSSYANIITKSISRSDALENCIKNHTANPGKAIRCIWDGKSLYSYTPGNLSNDTRDTNTGSLNSSSTISQASKNLVDRTIALIKVRINRISKTKKIAYIDAYIYWIQSNPGKSQKTKLTNEYMLLKLTELKSSILLQK